MEKLKVIVNADDFGNDENRTLAILRAFKEGLINHTTAMANMPFFPEASAMIKAEGRFDRMGLHFNLTEGPALSNEMRNCRFFCDSQGCFTGAFHHTVKWRLVLPAVAKQALVAEAKAQMRCFRKHGGESVHLDSHHHVHTDLSVARILFPIAREFGFKSVRLSRNFGGGIGLLKRIYKKVYNRIVIPAGWGWTDYFGDFRGFRDGYGKIPPGASFEVMVHPMFGRWECLDMKAEFSDSGFPMAKEGEFLASIRDRIEMT